MSDSRCSCVVSLLLLVATQTVGAGNSATEFEARRLIDSGKTGEAVTLIEKQLSPDQRGADAWFLLADAYHTLLDEAGLLKKRGLAKKMRQALEAALERDPDHVDARRELADFYYYAPWIVGGDKDEAEKQLAILERVAPAEAHTTRGEHARNAGDLNAARDHYTRALELGPHRPGRLFALAVVEQELDRHAESIRLLDEVIRADPDHEEAYYYRARASAMAGLEIERGLECAERYLEHCSECDDRDRSYGWWRRATLLKRMGKTEAAHTAYREALRFNPDLEGARKGLEELER